MQKKLNSYIELWFYEVVRHHAHSTQVQYKGIYKNKIKECIGQVTVDKLTRKRLIAYFRKLRNDGHTRSDIAGRLSVISGGLSMADENEEGHGVPADIFKIIYRGRKQAKKKIETFTTVETFKILEASKGKDYPLLLLLFRTGCRIGEALGLSWDAVDFEESCIEIKRGFRNGRLSEHTKTRTERTVPIDGEVLAELRKIRLDSHHSKYRDNEAVFTSRGERLCQNSVRARWNKILKNNDIPRRKIHCIRHTVATRLLDQGHPPKLVGELLGHSVMTLLTTYSHEDREADKKKREMLADLAAPIITAEVTESATVN